MLAVCGQPPASPTCRAAAELIATPDAVLPRKAGRTGRTWDRTRARWATALVPLQPFSALACLAAGPRSAAAAAMATCPCCKTRPALGEGGPCVLCDEVRQLQSLVVSAALPAWTACLDCPPGFRPAGGRRRRHRSLGVRPAAEPPQPQPHPVGFESLACLPAMFRHMKKNGAHVDDMVMAGTEEALKWANEELKKVFTMSGGELLPQEQSPKDPVRFAQPKDSFTELRAQCFGCWCM